MKNKSYLLSAAIMSVAILAAGCSSGTAVEVKPSVDLNDYVEVTSSGYDGFGTADFTFNSASMVSDVGNALTYGSVLKEEADQVTDKERIDFILEDDTISLKSLPIIASMVDCDVNQTLEALEDTSLSSFVTADIADYASMAPIELFESVLDCSINVDSNLSNGDTVIVKLNNADKLTDYFNFTLTDSEVVYNVENLTAIGNFNPFSSASMEFSGLNHEGIAELNIADDSEIMSEVNFVVTPQFELSNEDVVTVFAYVDDETAFAEKYGKAISTDKMTYTVSDLKSYLSKLSEVTSDSLAVVMLESEGILTNEGEGYTEDRFVQVQDFRDMDYVGSYLFTPTEDTETEFENLYYVVFKGTLVYTSGASVSGPRPYDYYTFVKYEDCMFGEDGELIMDDVQYSVPDNKLLLKERNMGGETYVYGYESLEDLYNDCVAQNVGYECESSM